MNRNQNPSERLEIGSSGRISSVGMDEIDWIRAAYNYVELHVGKFVHLLRQTLGSLERKFPPDLLVRISRSLIVNSLRVKELQPVVHDEFIVILREDTRLSATRNYCENVRRLFGTEL